MTEPTPPTPHSALRTAHSALRIGITVFLINAFCATTYLGNPMSKSILDLTVSLVDRRALDIDPYAGNSTDVARRNGHFYSGMPPGLSLVCVPYYLAAKTWLWLVATPERERATDERFLEAKGAVWRPSEKHLTIVLLNLFVCVFGCSVLAGAMAALFHRALANLYPDLHELRRLATTWLFCFDTLWFIYSPGVYHRIFSTFLCFAAFLLVLRNQGLNSSAEEGPQQPTRWHGLLVGLALGLAIATTYEMAIVAAILIIYTLAQWGKRWSWGWTMAGVAVFVVPLAAYHTGCFGAPWATPYAARIQGSVVPPVFRGGPNVSASAVKRAAEFLFGSRCGFFFYSPLLLLALPALARLWPNPASSYSPPQLTTQHSTLRTPRGAVAVSFAIFLSLLAFHYLTGYEGLPGEFGFRMMKPAIPFLMLLVPLSYRWSYRCVVPTLAALSAVILAKGVMFGVHAGRPFFWSDYLGYISRYGFSNYTLANLKDNLWPTLSPWTISAIHIAALGLIGFLLWRFVWRRGVET